MTAIRVWAARIRGLFFGRRRDLDLQEELRLHLEMQVEDNIEAGMSLEEAHFAARRSFGGIEQVKEEYRDLRGVPVVEALGRDLRHAARMLRRAPGFTVVALATLALGIGAGTAVFSVVNAVLLRSLAVPNPQDLRVLQWTGMDVRVPSLAEQPMMSSPRVTAHSFPYPLFSSLQKTASAEADIFGFIPIDAVAARARGDAFAADGVMVSDNFFDGLGVRPLVGRLFRAGDEGGTASNVVITQGWWERLYARDPAAVGQAVVLNGAPFNIVGVLPADFGGVLPGERREFYVLMSARPQFFKEPFQTFTSSQHWWVRLMARLKPGVGDAQLGARLTTAFALEGAEFMNEPKVLVAPGRAGLSVDRNHYARPLLLMLAAVGLVMLVACANLAGLSLARGAARQHELAVRVAIGAGRLALVRQALVESLLLALSGGGLGVLLAVWGRTAISRLLAGSDDGLHYDLSLDLHVLAFSLALALATAFATGLLPALRVGQMAPMGALKSRGVMDAPRMRIGNGLVSAQFALSLILLSGAGLYLRSFANLERVDPGFQTDNLLTFEVNPASVGYEDARLLAFNERLQDSLVGLPGVNAASLVQYPLLDNKRWIVGFGLPGHHDASTMDLRTHRLIVGERFFETMGIPMTSGRALSVSDRGESPKVAVVNEAFVRTHFANEDPLGQILRIFGVDWRIVGVSRDATYENVKMTAPETVYNSFRQYPVRVSSAFVVRATVPPLALSDAVRKAVAAIDPGVPVTRLASQSQLRDANVSQERLLATLCGVLAGLAWLLSCIGLYGLMAYQVTRRTHEIAIRMAVGARPGEVARRIVRDSLRLAALGMGLGIPGVLVMSRLVQSQLFEVEANDPTAFAGAIMALAAVALLGAWLPALRATRVTPLTALRTE